MYQNHLMRPVGCRAQLKQNYHCSVQRDIIRNFENVILANVMLIKTTLLKTMCAAPNQEYTIYTSHYYL